MSGRELPEGTGVMTISGIVITLSADDGEEASERLAARDEIELGVPTDHRLPAVIDAPDSAASRRLFSWIEELDGVDHVDVVFVSTESESQE